MKFDKNKCTNFLIDSTGANFQEILETSTDKILVPKSLKDTFNNVVRYELDQGNVSNLKASLINGIDYTQRMIIIKKIRPTQVDGITYHYQLIDGFHRMAALREIGQTNWLFAVYEFDSLFAEIDFQFAANDFPARKPHTPEDIANYLGVLIEKGFIENTEEAMRAKMKEKARFIHATTITAGIKKAVRQNGTYVDIKTYSFDDVRDFIGCDENYPENTPKYVTCGEVDKNRKELGWSIKEGYEAEFVMNAMKGLAETGKPSYFLLHTKTPTEKRDLITKRSDMLKTFESIEHRIEEAVLYKEKTGNWPWRVEAYFPQDNRNGEYVFLPSSK